jgi:hypothetical protein
MDYFSNANEGIDAFLSSCAKARKKIVTDLFSEYSNTDGYILPVDDDCLCQMCSTQECIRNDYACSPCFKMRHLIDFRKCTADHPCRIQCGSLMGKFFIVHKFKDVHPIQEFQDDKIIVDPFTLQVLVNWSIEKLFNTKSLPNILTYFNAFICHHHGYIMSEVPNIGKLSQIKNLNSSTIRGIILQLLVILKTLEEINFFHGLAQQRDTEQVSNGLAQQRDTKQVSNTSDSMVFTKDIVSYNYQGIHVECPYTLKLTGFNHSSVTINDITLLGEGMRDELYEEKYLIPPTILTSGKYYKFSYNTLAYYLLLRNSGSNLFKGSFDFYCFFVSLMRDETFREIVLHDSSLSKLWYSLWTQEDGVDITNKLMNNDPESTHRLLKGYWLNADIMDELIVSLKSK